MDKEARLNINPKKLVVTRVALATYGVAVQGAPSLSAVGASSAKPDNEDALEKKEQRLRKKKLPTPNDGWKDAKDVTIHSYADRHLLHQQLFGIFKKLRRVLREQARLAPMPSNAT